MPTRYDEEKDRFSQGLQWHPETGWSTDRFARSIFTAFVDAARDVR